MKLFPFSRPSAGRELATPGREVRVFQSDTAAIIDGPRPIQANITLYVVIGLVASLLLIAMCMRVDRVISSTSGEIVTVDPTVVLGALDQSIIKTIDVAEGQKVEKGELLATLDPTFTTADVGSLKAQVASLDARSRVARRSWRRSRLIWHRGVVPSPITISPRSATTICSARRSSTHSCAPITTRSRNTRRRSSSTRTMWRAIPIAQRSRRRSRRCGRPWRRTRWAAG